MALDGGMRPAAKVILPYLYTPANFLVHDVYRNRARLLVETTGACRAIGSFESDENPD